MKRSYGPRKTSQLSDPLQHRLNMYALAAGAAGMGMIAIPSPAEAKIIYTPTNQKITAQVPIDFNGDGITDVTLAKTSTVGCTSSFCGNISTIYAFAPISNKIWGRNASSASALPPRFLIGNNQRRFSNTAGRMAFYYAKCRPTGGSCKTYKSGQWANVNDRYLAVEFKIAGENHYGWARLTVNANHGLSATLTGYAYESIAGKPILIGNGVPPPGNENLEESPVSVSPAQHATLGRIARGYVAGEVQREAH